MSELATALSFLGLLALSAIVSGSETAVYSLSRLRLESDLRRGVRSARWIRSLLRDDRTLLVTVLIGNNLAIELLTVLSEHELDHRLALPPSSVELVTALFLTPIVFLFAELLPKDLFRRRPHAFLGSVAPVVLALRFLLYPIVWPVRWFSAFLERALSLRGEELFRALGREEVLELLDEGRRTGALPPDARQLADNVLDLRHLVLRDVMVPWSEVERVDLGEAPARVRERLVAARHTRVLAMGPGGGRVAGYVHQLELLAAGPHGEPGAHLRPLQVLDPSTSVDAALHRLRVAGLRIALVGSARTPVGIVTLKDLVEEISGELAGW